MVLTCRPKEQNRELRNTLISNGSSTRDPKSHNKERTVSATNGNLGIDIQKNDPELFIIYIKINSK